MRAEEQGTRLSVDGRLVRVSPETTGNIVRGKTAASGVDMSTVRCGERGADGVAVGENGEECWWISPVSLHVCYPNRSSVAYVSPCAVFGLLRCGRCRDHRSDRDISLLLRR